VSRFRALGVLIVTSVLVAGLQPAASAVEAPHDQVVAAVPTAGTPSVNNGTVLAITKVGNTMVLGGSFTTASPSGAAGTVYNLPYVMAFDATTGVINTNFLPGVNKAVNAVLPGPTANTVYIGGNFTTVGGQTIKGLTLVNLSDGSRVAGFTTPVMNGLTNTIQRVGNRLFVGGTFTVAAGKQRGGMVTLNATTGAVDNFMVSKVTVNHNWTSAGGGAKAAVGVTKLEITPDGTKLVAIGNFKFADGLERDQVAMWDLTGPTAVVRADYRIRGYEAACYSFAFDTYMRDLKISPDGTYFAIAATGGGTDGNCDTAARWEIGASGQDIPRTWASYAGGDSILSVAITGPVVYAGGHQRWMNNPNGNDFAGPGSVPRPGLVALDADTGMPIAWNPGRNPRGSGAWALFSTPDGLWMGSDTNTIGPVVLGGPKYTRKRIAFFPLAGGAPVASDAISSLPGGIYLGGSTASTPSAVLQRVNFGGDAIASIDGGPNWQGDGGQFANTGHLAGYGPVANVDATVPPSTPRAIFDTERWDDGGAPEMQLTLPVPAGRNITVRLYFANRYDGTSGVGGRVFDVSVNGTLLLNDYDIVADVGDQTGTMKTRSISAAQNTGQVTIDFGHIQENPLINGVEIVDDDFVAPPPPPPGALVEYNYDGTTVDPAFGVTSPLDFNLVRGATLIGGTLFYGKTDSNLYRRTFDGTTFGTEKVVDPYNDPIWADVDTGSGGTFRGQKPSFYGEIPNLTSMFYDGSGKLYYTLFGDSRLFWRGFSPDSGIIHNQRNESGSTLPAINGAFLDAGSLYYVTSADGKLNKVGFVGGQIVGAPVVADAGVDWRARSLFLGPALTNVAPVASFTTTCEGFTCTFDGSDSTDSDGTISDYVWDFGDGDTDSVSGAEAAHTYTDAGTYTVTLTVTDNRGANDSTSSDLTAPAPEFATIAYRASAQAVSNSTQIAVTIPATVQVGDALVLFVSSAASATPTVPAGWTQVGSTTTDVLRTTVFRRIAATGVAGSVVTVPVGVMGKNSAVLGAYSGVDPGAPVAQAVALSDQNKTAHISPVVSVTSGQGVVSYWVDRSSAASGWTVGAGALERIEAVGSGSGRHSAVLADAGAPVATGSAGGVTATAVASSSRATSWTVVLNPAVL
jgi:PKD repeat protein